MNGQILLTWLAVKVYISIQYNPVAWKQSSHANTFSKHYCLQQGTLKPCCILTRLLFAIFEQTSSLQVLLGSSNDQDQADGQV
jgi:hypothetical protein